MHYEFSQKPNKFCYRLKRFRKEGVLIFQGVPGTEKGDFGGGRQIHRLPQKRGSKPVTKLQALSEKESLQLFITLKCERILTI
jgi:hypothetical protein